MVHLRFSIRLSYEIVAQPADFIFNIQAAMTPRQKLVAETLLLSQAVATAFHVDPLRHNRLARLRAAPGRLDVDYRAEVEIDHHTAKPHDTGEMPIMQLPPEVLPFLYPSRYCESDKLQALANREFGHLPRGYARVDAIRRWVTAHVRFVSGSSNFSTSALDTLNHQTGVCRDFAHLMIALCRALNMPARFCSGLDYGADPALGPTDFHAYVEVYLDGRWYLFDPSGTAMPMGLLRIGTGRDAADIAFATIFGTIRSELPVLSIDAVEDPTGRCSLPHACEDALSTDG